MIIVDDLVRSGGTLIECAKVLRRNGAKKVLCFVTHAEFPNGSWKKFMHEDCPVDIFVTTNTIPRVTDTLPKEKFEVLDVSYEIKSIFRD